MIISLNGKDVDFGEGSTLTMVIERYRLNADTVVIEHNGIIIKRDMWSQTILSPGDRIELVTFVGGGD